MKFLLLATVGSTHARRFLGTVLVAIVFVCATQAGELFVQSELRGRVLDPNRAAIAGARITAVRKGVIASISGERAQVPRGRVKTSCDSAPSSGNST